MICFGSIKYSETERNEQPGNKFLSNPILR
jgi:hypothetical protein